MLPLLCHVLDNHSFDYNKALVTRTKEEQVQAYGLVNKATLLNWVQQFGSSGAAITFQANAEYISVSYIGNDKFLIAYRDRDS